MEKKTLNLLQMLKRTIIYFLAEIRNSYLTENIQG